MNPSELERWNQELRSQSPGAIVRWALARAAGRAVGGRRRRSRRRCGRVIAVGLEGSDAEHFLQGSEAPAL